MNIINFTIAMYLSIFIHELGHYLSCKAFKIPVKTFSIGFGPKLFRFKNLIQTLLLSLFLWVVMSIMMIMI